MAPDDSDRGDGTGGGSTAKSSSPATPQPPTADWTDWISEVENARRRLLAEAAELQLQSGAMASEAKEKVRAPLQSMNR